MRFSRAALATIFWILPPAVSAQTTITLGADTPSAIKPLLGVVLGPQPSGEGTVDLTTRYQAAGVTMIRTHDYDGPFDMFHIYPNQNADPTRDTSFNWTSSDATFRKILDGGFEPYIRIGDSDNHPVSNTANWAAAATAVIRRYSDSARWGRNAIRYVEIYNEPDSRTFWSGTPDAFNQLYIATAKAIKAAFPSIKVGGCGFTGLQYQPLPGVAQGGFLRPFLSAVSSAGAPLDFLSWHTYLLNPTDITTGAQYFRAQLNAYGFPNAESILSEWNTDFEGPQGGDAALRTGARGSSILAATWINLQLTDVVYSMLYRGPDPSLNLPTFYGMWYTDGRPKPAALAQTLFSQMAKYGTRVSTSSSSSGIYALAAKNASGERAILISNTSSSAGSWQISGTTGSGSVYRMQEIGGAATAIATSTLSSLASPIPAYGVQLVTITSGSSATISGLAGAGGSVPAVNSISSNGYFTLYGSGLAAAGTARDLQPSDLVGNSLPTNLGGTCVNVGNVRAYLRYVSPGQVNALAPTLSGSSVAVSVVVNCGTASEAVSASMTAPVASASPEFLYFALNGDGKNPVAAVNSLTGAYVGQTNLLPAATFTPAKAGDLVTLFGVGFGAVVPGTTPGALATSAAGLASGATLSIGGKVATVSYAGLAPSFAGLYQINLVVPAGLGAGSQVVAATVNGVQVAEGGRIFLQ